MKIINKSSLKNLPPYNDVELATPNNILSSIHDKVKQH